MTSNSDTELEGSADTGPAEIDHYAVQEKQQTREKEQDAKLDAVVRESAKLAFSREHHERDPSPGSIDQTIERVHANIMARKPEPVMPPLAPGADLDAHVRAAEEWNRASKADQRVISDGHKQLADLKAQAENLGVKVESASDLLAIRQMLGQQQSNATSPEASPPGEVWSALGLGPEVCATEAEAREQFGNAVRYVQQNGVRGMREVNERLGYSPLEMLTREEIEAIRGQPLPPPTEEAQVAYFIQEWAEGRNITEAEWDLMGAIAQEPKFRAAKASKGDRLNSALREARRRIAVHGKRPLDQKMTETLQASVKGGRR